MQYETLLNNIKAGKYQNRMRITDPDYTATSKQLRELFKTHLRQFGETELKTKLTDNQFQILYEHATHHNTNCSLIYILETFQDDIILIKPFLTIG